MELDREEKVRVFFDSFYPGKGDANRRRPVESAVDLDDIDILGEEDKRMESCGFLHWIDNALPVWVAPAGCSDKIMWHADLF